MTDTYAILKKYDDILFQNICLATQGYLFSRKLSTLNPNHYNIDNHLFFYHEFLYINSCCIHISKIFKTSEYYCFKNYLLKTKELSPNPTKKNIDFYINKYIEIERKHSIVINLAIRLRDKYYSHVDKKYLKTIELAQSESNFFELLESMFSDLQNLYLIYNFAIFKKPSGFDNIIDYELLAKLCEPFKKN